MDLKNNKNRWKHTKFKQSFYHACQGLKTVMGEERNLRFHLLAAALALVLGWFLKLAASEWLWLFLSITLVIINEIWNTVAENIVDLVTDYQYHILAKKAKDMAAGAVLLSAFFALIVALIIFVPKIYNLLLS
ncbi:hypothetical protein FC81_GL001397 [Liquorilactobacillus capillatus DSM 19910]|uniref:Diacylglycerol kinase n=2 Tax=Liquorilactobacillus capillatus TaxID=480931 RepID=A0A0R1MCT7_9LACO|nr:diacylglycerol kinase family protein [Liquorilactobacillus capillatus]KRL01256.1 hypothetical protein FC81_GL001397 [Liquorilactobacillus capillatus DSM 19910]